MTAARAHHLLIALILLLAVVLRVAALSPYAIHHPDEALQYLEQAHRLTTGTGLVPWEYRLGMRSWLVPLLLAGPMWLGDAIAPGSLLYVILARLTAAIFAFAAVMAAYWVGRRISPAHGLMAMLVAAIWYENVYFSVHVLTEILSAAAFLSAVAVLTPGASRRRLVAGGALLALSAIIRFHYTPAILAFALISFGFRWRDWLWLALGGLGAALISSAVDLAMGQWPFAWVYQNFHQNVIADKASEFGRLGAEAYGQMLWLHWSVAIVPILWLAALAARRFPALAAAALVNLVVHLAIGHKEYRFIFLTVEIVVLLAAIGSVDLVDRLRRDLSGRAPGRNLMLAGAVGLWALASGILAFSDLSNPGWRRFEGGFRLARQAAEHRACGVALMGDNYWATGGHLYLGGLPLHYIFPADAAVESNEIAATRHAYDAIIAPENRMTPQGFRRIDCQGEGREHLCLAIRTGGCRRDAASDARLLQRVMEAHDR
ncbi:hypothetical protein ACMGDH_00610 [Sphingomonas sp. DT-207]